MIGQLPRGQRPSSAPLPVVETGVPVGADGFDKHFDEAMVFGIEDAISAFRASRVD